MVRNSIKDKTLNIYISDDIDQMTSETACDLIYGCENIDNISNIVLSINSPGGSVINAMDIINACKKSSKKVKTRVEGIAASAAFLIWLSTPIEDRQVTSNALIMMHNPSNSDSNTLEYFKSSIETYISDSTDITKEIISKMMDMTTWMDVNDMIENGIIINSNVIKSSKKYFNEIIDKILNVTNKIFSDDFEDVSVKNKIEEDMNKEMEAIIEEQKNLIDTLTKELNDLKDIQNKIEEDRINSEKSELLKDVENKEIFMKMDIEDIKVIVNEIKNTKVIVKSPVIELKKENIRDLSNVSLSELSSEEKYDLYVNNKQEYDKLFYKK